MTSMTVPSLHAFNTLEAFFKYRRSSKRNPETVKCSFCLLSWAHEYWGRYTLVSAESAASLQSLHDSGDKAMRVLFPMSPSEVLGSMDSLSQQENGRKVEATHNTAHTRP